MDRKDPYTTSDVAAAMIDVHLAHAALLRAVMGLPETTNDLRVKIERTCADVNDILTAMDKI